MYAIGQSKELVQVVQFNFLDQRVLTSFPYSLIFQRPRLIDIASTQTHNVPVTQQCDCSPQNLFCAMDPCLMGI